MFLKEEQLVSIFLNLTVFLWLKLSKKKQILFAYIYFIFLIYIEHSYLHKGIILKISLCLLQEAKEGTQIS